MTHICVSNIITIGSDNGLLPGRRQAIIWTNAGILLIGPLGLNFNEILIEIDPFSIKKMDLKTSSATWRLSFLGLIFNENQGALPSDLAKTRHYKIYVQSLTISAIALTFDRRFDNCAAETYVNSQSNTILLIQNLQTSRDLIVISYGLLNICPEDNVDEYLDAVLFFITTFSNMYIYIYI